ncbi:hypothetical protein BDD12DRAFT_810641 [Trichophaea hybrida]|nr:hypothetical protein BDD12DRAFT_810641 [Trichophaea hybrida]
MGVITITVNSKEYSIDTVMMPYFDSNSSSNHNIEHFDVAFRCVCEGFHIAFETFRSDLTNYPGLCTTLKLLEVDVLGGIALPEIIEHSRKFGFDDDEEKIICTNLAEDWVFKFLYMHHLGLLLSKDRQRIFNAVTYIIEHRYLYNHYTRSVIRETYKMMNPTKNQLGRINKWPVYDSDGEPLPPVPPRDDPNDYDDWDDSESEAYFRTWGTYC